MTEPRRPYRQDYDRERLIVDADGELLGVMETPDLAERVVAALSTDDAEQDRASALAYARDRWAEAAAEATGATRGWQEAVGTAVEDVARDLTDSTSLGWLHTYVDAQQAAGGLSYGPARRLVGAIQAQLYAYHRLLSPAAEDSWLLDYRTTVVMPEEGPDAFLMPSACTWWRCATCGRGRIFVRSGKWSKELLNETHREHCGVVP